MFCSMDQSAPNQSRHVVGSSAWKSCCRLTRWWKLRYAVYGGPTRQSVASGHVKLHNYPTVKDSKHLPCSCLQTQTCLSTPALWITGSLPETKPQTVATPHDYTTEITLVFLQDFISCSWCSRLFTTTRDCYLFLFNEMTKQQICICKSRCCNKFDYSWPKACKRGLSTTAVSKVLVFWWAVKTPPSVEVCIQNDNMN